MGTARALRARRSASAGCSPPSCPTNPKRTVSSPLWSSSPPGCSARIGPYCERLSCCSTKTAADGTASTSGGAKPRWSGQTSSATTWGPYTLQAAIAACHARSFRPEETDWDELVALYTALACATPSPIVELNRAVAVSWASGPEEALALVDVLIGTGTLERYHLLYSVRGDLLDRLGRYAEAATEFQRAAALATNGQERTLLTERVQASLHRC